MYWIVSNMIMRAHRQRLSCGKTHQPPAAAVGCCRGTAASNTPSSRRGQSPSAPLRHTWPTLTNIPSPQGNPTHSGQLPSPPRRPSGKGRPHPWGLKAAAAAAPAFRLWSARRPAQLPYLTQTHWRSTLGNARPKSPNLRRSCCFGSGLLHFGSLCASCRRWQLRHDVPPYRGTQPAPNAKPAPKAHRPPLHLSKRYAGRPCALPLSGYSVRPLCVYKPQGTQPASGSAG